MLVGLSWSEVSLALRCRPKLTQTGDDLVTKTVKLHLLLWNLCVKKSKKRSTWLVATNLKKCANPPNFLYLLWMFYRVMWQVPFSLSIRSCLMQVDQVGPNTPAPNQFQLSWHNSFSNSNFNSSAFLDKGIARYNERALSPSAVISLPIQLCSVVLDLSLKYLQNFSVFFDRLSIFLSSIGFHISPGLIFFCQCTV